MEPSQSCIDLVKESEGFRSSEYVDATGNATIGYGHKIRPHETFTTITESQAESLLLDDLNAAADQMEALVKVPLTQGQYDALCDFTFNEGAGQLSTSMLLRKLNGRDYEGACHELYWTDERAMQHGWIYAGGKVLSGLIIRRKREQALWGQV